MRKRMVGLVVVLGLAAPMAFAQGQTLRESTFVTERLVAAQAGDWLRKACPEASVRWMRVWSQAESLKAWARSNGHSEASVRAFLKDPKEKERVRAAARAHLAARGYDETPASACAVARMEVVERTLMGTLLSIPAAR